MRSINLHIYREKPISFFRLSHMWWLNAWRGKPPGKTILFAALLVGLLMSVPVIYILYRAALSDTDVWVRLWNTRIPYLLANTLVLTTTTTCATVILAVPLAWLVTRSDLPGRKTYKWLLALPMAIPPYIGALAYIFLFGFDGVLKTVVASLAGGALALPDIYSLWGTTLVLSLFTFPYTFLLVAAALETMSASCEEAARACGYSSWSVFWSATLPMLRPAIGAGSLLVALYVLSDFGVVAMLRYDTFTSAIYTQLVGRYDRSAAAVLGLILVAITLAAVWLEWRSRAKARYYQNRGSHGTAPVVPLGSWRYLALAWVWLVLSASVIFPLLFLIAMTYQGLVQGAIGQEFWRYTLNSFTTAAAGATLASLLALPVAYLSARHDSFPGKLFARISYAGYALPGVVIALGIVFVASQFLPMLYGTPVLLTAAYVVRFMPQGLQAQESALALISPNLEEAAQTCGYSHWEALWRITFPLIRPGLIAGWILIFLNSMKELPATLLLRPAGFDTLSVRIWIEASEGFYTLAAPAALLLVAVSLIPLRFLAVMKHERRG